MPEIMTPPPPPQQPISNWQPGTCPKCGSPNVEKVSFTWWGGILAPGIYKIHKCRECKTEFNNKNGEVIGAKQIIIYTVIILGILFVIIIGCGILSVVISALGNM